MQFLQTPSTLSVTLEMIWWMKLGHCTEHCW